MAKEWNFSQKIVPILIGLAVLFGLTGVVLKVYGQETRVAGIESDGRLVLDDGRTITLAKVRVKTPGEEGYEAAIFLLSQMLSNKEVWITKSENGNYAVWIGCVKNVLGFADCSKGVQVNEALLKAGMAVKQ